MTTGEGSDADTITGCWSNLMKRTPHAKSKQSLRWSILGPFYNQEYDNMMSLFETLGVVAALLASLLFGLVMTIPHEEFVRGDKESLAYGSPAFRCRFSPNASLEICSPEYTNDLMERQFGLNCDWRESECRYKFCQQSPEVITVEPRRAYYAGNTEGSEQRMAFRCGIDIARYTTTTTNPTPPWLYGQWFMMDRRSLPVYGCTATALKLARHIAEDVTDAQYLDFVDDMEALEHSATRDAPYVSADFFPPPYWDRCLPSGMVAAFGFPCCFKLMISVIVAAYALISLSISNAKNDPREMAIWWFPGGLLAGTSIVVFCLLGCRDFMVAAESIVAIRFPRVTQWTRWKLFAMDEFIRVGVMVCGLVAFFHWALVRIIASFVVKYAGPVDGAQRVELNKSTISVEVKEKGRKMPPDERPPISPVQGELTSHETVPAFT